MTILHTPPAAIPPRSGQHGTGKAPPRSCQAATFPTPQADPSQASAGNSASSGSSAPPSSTPRPMTGFLATLSEAGRKAALEYDGPETHGDPAFMNIDPAFFAAWRESQGQTVDAEARR